MPRPALRATLAAVVAVAAGCGDGSDGGKRAAGSWLAAVEEERWADACARLTDPPSGCEEGLKESYGSRELKLLAKGEYIQGDESNDNETRFAFVASRAGKPDRTAVFEVVGEDRVRFVIEVEQAG